MTMNQRRRLEHMGRILVAILLIRSLFLLLVVHQHKFMQANTTTNWHHDSNNSVGAGAGVGVMEEQITSSTTILVENNHDDGAIVLAEESATSSLVVVGPQQEQSQQLSLPGNEETHWCRFNHSTLADSMAHIHDLFMPCWSWLQSFQKNTTTTSSISSSNHCGFIFGRKNSFYFLRKNTLDKHWRLDLFQAMNCTITEVRNANDFQPLIVKEPSFDTMSVTGSTRFRFHDPSHAWALRDAVLRRFQSSLVVDDTVRPTMNSKVAAAGAPPPPPPPPPRIGFLQRGGTTRLINNMTELISYIRDRLPPESEITYDTWGYEEKLSLVSQAEWFASKDIIIAAHGQALSNTIFIRNSTVVIEVFPRNWGWLTFYGCTIVQAGGRYMYYYDGNGRTIESDWIHNHKKSLFKSQNITVRPESLWRLVETALQEDFAPDIVLRGSTEEFDQGITIAISNDTTINFAGHY